MSIIGILNLKEIKTEKDNLIIVILCEEEK